MSQAAPSIPASDVESSSAPGPGAESPADPVVDEFRSRLRTLPPEVGVVLVGVGGLGLILPGIVGTPLLLAGAVVLMPSVFTRCERWAQRRFPKSHHIGMCCVERFVDDLEKRYPNTKTAPADN